jgi:hypothetical protein
VCFFLSEMSSVSNTSAELAGITEPKPRVPVWPRQRCGARATASGERTVREIRGDRERALLALAHADEALVPALDNLADADCRGIS